MKQSGLILSMIAKLKRMSVQTALDSHDLKMNFLSFENDFHTANYKCIDIYAKRINLAYISMCIAIVKEDHVQYMMFICCLKMRSSLKTLKMAPISSMTLHKKALQPGMTILILILFVTML